MTESGIRDGFATLLGACCHLKSQDVLQIATSATIGSADVTELKAFAASLFSKAGDRVKVIVGRPSRIALGDLRAPGVEATPDVLGKAPWLQRPTLVMDQSGESLTLARDDEAVQTLTALLPKLVDSSQVDAALKISDSRPAILLRKTLEHAPIIHRLEQTLADHIRLSLPDLTTFLWHDDSDLNRSATLELLKLGAVARDQVGSYPLIPHRLHLLVRPCEGLSVCLNANCTVQSDDRRMDGLGLVFAGIHDHCPECGAAALPLWHCKNCGEWGLAAEERDNRLRPRPAGFDQQDRAQVLCLTTRPVTIVEQVKLNPLSGEKRIDGTLVLGKIELCPNCEASTNRVWSSFAGSTSLTLSILAETTLAGLPKYPGLSNGTRPAAGRRVLAFSDSRPEAARLGPRLTYQHETQLVRAANARYADALPETDDALLVDCEEEVTRAEEKLRDPRLNPAQRANWGKKLDAARRQRDTATEGSSIENWIRELWQDPKSQLMLAQILDAEGGNHHEARTWSAEKWEENSLEVRKMFLPTLGRELASPSRASLSVETLGLVEVVYPGLVSFGPVEAFLGSLGTNETRGNVRQVWSDFLAALCDDIRSDVRLH